MFVDVVDPKVVKNKDEGDRANSVEIQARSILGREVPSSGQDFLELLVGKFTSLLEAYMARRISMQMNPSVATLEARL